MTIDREHIRFLNMLTTFIVSHIGRGPVMRGSFEQTHRKLLTNPNKTTIKKILVHFHASLKISELVKIQSN